MADKGFTNKHMLSQIGVCLNISPVIEKTYQHLSEMSVDSVFDADWKDKVENSVSGYSSLLDEVADALLDKEIENSEIAKMC